MVRANQHGWKQSVSEHSDHGLRVLEESAERLKWAWQTDKKYPKSFPIHTDTMFNEIRRQLTKGSPDKSEQQTLELPSPPPAPMCLSELVDEKTIKAAYELQNDGRYEDALRLAAPGDKESYIVWRKILNAVNAAYLIHAFGDEFIPRPEVHYLHRNLLEIADLSGMNELTHSGIAGFLDDLCPCGKEHKAETIRKLRKRWARGKRPKH